ncbi:NAD(P)-dependent oxidoreductase [Oxalobacter formigenes]|nr:NAD(P)H-binding protein [Oxalobacter formigenes]ARQ79295.1 3-beta hydroxysteroid dehydrogenase [Oxalobacter formigenes OXCC13]QDX34143.1 NAD-dependent epimerase/dehydratase family protein [Oxalobacter formigenes]
MRLVIFGGGGMIGRPIIEEALRRNHEVIAVDPFPDRIPIKNPNLTIIQTDVYSVDRVSELVRKADAVIVSHNPAFEQPDLFDSVLKLYPFILEGVKEAGVPRILFVGEAGTLYVEPGIMLMDTGAISGDEASGIRMLGGFYLDVLKHEHDIDWVYFSPAADIVPAPLTGSYRLGENDLIVNPDGFSLISSGDYASALMDEIDAPVHHNERFTIGY